jgi:hypothetical protein
MGDSADPIETFISYAHADRDLCEDVFAALDHLQERRLVRLWYADKSAVPGDELTTTIQDRLRSAQLVLLFATTTFLRSDWVAKEVRFALDRRQKDKARVIPVILQECDWKRTSLADLLALPEDGRALTQWDDRAAGIESIVRGVAEAAEELRTPAPSPEFALFTAADIREMARTVEQSILAIRKATQMYPVPPAQTLIELAELKARLKAFQCELRRRNELM